MEQARQGTLRTPDGALIDYVVLGSGPRRLVYVPGAGDGLATAREAVSRVTLWMQRKARHFEVLYLSRRRPLPERFDVRAQAADVIWALEALGWGPAVIEGQSAGGPVAIVVAEQRPDLVPVLVLSSTTAFLDEVARAQCAGWLELARAGQWEAFSASLASHYWPASQLRLLRSFGRILSDITSPLDPQRMVRTLAALLEMDVRREASGLLVPTLVLGGQRDAIFSPSLQEATAALIPAARVQLHPDFGHGHELENPRHDDLVAAFARMHRGVLASAAPHVA